SKSISKKSSAATGAENHSFHLISSLPVGIDTTSLTQDRLHSVPTRSSWRCEAPESSSFAKTKSSPSTSTNPPSKNRQLTTDNRPRTTTQMPVIQLRH